MTYTLAGQAQHNTWGATLPVAYAGSAGNLLVAYCTSNGDVTVTDNGGNTWQMIGDTRAHGGTSHTGGQMFYTLAESDCTTVTFTRVGSNNYAATVAEFSGVTGYRAARVNYGTNPDGTVETAPGDLVIATAFYYNATGTPNATPAGYSPLTASVRDSFVVSGAYREADSASTTATWSTSTRGVINAAFTGDTGPASNAYVSVGGVLRPSMPHVRVGGVWRPAR